MKNKASKARHSYSKIVDETLIYSYSKEELYRLESTLLNAKIEQISDDKSLTIIKSNQESLVNLPIYTDTKSQSMYNNYLYNLICGSLTWANLELDLFDSDACDKEENSSE